MPVRRPTVQPLDETQPVLYVKPPPDLVFRLSLVFADPELHALKVRVGSVWGRSHLRGRDAARHAVPLRISKEARQTLINLFSGYMGTCWLADDTTRWSFHENSEHWINRDGTATLTIQEGPGTSVVVLTLRKFRWKM